jgi:iron complex outermembrane receptor protein
MRQQPLLGGFWLVAVLIAQPAWAQVAQVTAVQLNSTSSSLEILLSTAGGATTLVQSSRSQQRFVAEITNAQLALPQGNTFRQDNPTEEIASVTVTPLDANRIQVVVTGKTGAPIGQIFLRQGQGLVVRLAAPAETAEKPVPSPTPSPEPQAEDLEPIELVVTAERETETGYQVPDATTATKTETPLQDIPQSIQVVPQQVLEDQQATRLKEALENVSGIASVNPARAVFDTYKIRGFDTRNILRNGLRDDNNVTTGAETANLERIEVLKGPASVLYGPGGIGGTINLVTKKPLSDPFYRPEFEIGNYAFYRPSFDLSGPLNADKTVLYRLNASYQDSGSFVDFFNTKRAFIAPALTWRIGDQTTLTFEAEYLDSRHSNDTGLPARGTVLSNPNGKIPINRFLGEPSFDKNDRRVGRAGYVLEHRFNNDWSLRSAFGSSLQSYEQAQTFATELLPDNRTVNRIVSTGDSTKNIYTLATDLVGDFTTGSIEHKLLVGFDLYKQDLKEDGNFAPLAPIDLFDPKYGAKPGKPFFFTDTFSKRENLGLYLQDQISLLDNLKLIVGGRFDIVYQTLQDALASTTIRQQNEAFSPRVGIVYQPIEPVSLYASFSRSFDPVTGTGFDNKLFEPERGTQYEVGIKTDFLDGRLFSTLAFYDLTRQNVLTTDPRNPNLSIQTGEQRSRGIELDVIGEILPGWNVIASYAYTDARITKDNDFPIGNRLSVVPEHSARLWMTYEIQRGSLQGLGFGGGLLFLGDRQGDLGNSFTLPSYLRTDAAVYYRKNNWKAALNIKNLFNVKYFETAFGELYVLPGSPLSVVGSVSVEF